MFTALRGCKARVLREDFCGTANVCCALVRWRTTCRAIGVDIDAEVLISRAHNLPRLARDCGAA
ncbi:MAG: hypothetical protein H6978_09435 [Gammaproteobacteria bacterium]|nr:hypothetical protein [Gammaproteobacteria bacterium]